MARKPLPKPVGSLDICTKCGRVRGPVKYLPAFKKGAICWCPTSPARNAGTPLRRRRSASQGSRR